MGNLVDLDKYRKIKDLKRQGVNILSELEYLQSQKKDYLEEIKHINALVKAFELVDDNEYVISNNYGLVTSSDMALYKQQLVNYNQQLKILTKKIKKIQWKLNDS